MELNSCRNCNVKPVLVENPKPYNRGHKIECLNCGKNIYYFYGLDNIVKSWNEENPKIKKS